MIQNRFLSFYTIISLFCCFTLGSCSDDVEIVSDTDEYATVTFDADLDAGIESRAISDGQSVNKIDVLVFDGNTLVQRISEQNFNPAGGNNLKLRLLSNRTYSVLFWAYNGANSAYTLSDAGTVSVDYNSYATITNFGNIEQLDAFYAKESVTISGDNSSQNVTLTRPLAQVNFADDATKPVNGTHTCEITYTALPKEFNLHNGNVTSSAENVKFTFSNFTDEELIVDGTTYYYVASNYIFVPQDGKVSANCVLKASGTEVTNKTVNDIVIAANKRTNICGTIVQAPEDKWDGSVTLPLTTDENNRYIISATANLAWLAQNGATLEPNRTFVITKDLDMNNKSLQTVKLPAGSTVEGGEHTIKNLSINGGGLFGDVTNLTVNNLIVDGLTMSGAATHVGALVNTLKGSGAFAGVAVKNVTVTTTNGAAGGFVGYVVRKSEKERTETLSLTFSNSTIENATIAGSKSEGKFVGLLSGYDNAETVSFDATCSVADNVTVADFTSPYREGNEGAWLATTDYSKYSGWLGDETYNRGTVNYGGIRFIPCWDGSKTVEPLTDATGAKLIYSAFDLAKLQGGSHTSVIFKENVDLGGDKANKNLFKPINTISKLDGENHSLYNLNIYYENWVVGFVLGTYGDTEHKNLHFVNSSVRAKMKGDEVQVYVGTLNPYIQHKYVVNNVTVANGYLFGLCKVGGLIGFVTSESSASLDCKNCSVKETTIENIESSTFDRFGNNLVYADFYPQGEVGGLIGAIMNDVTISQCEVSDCNINCYGQDMKYATILIEGLNGLFAVPGRHVNGFIGDIRTVNGDVITLTNCKSQNNTFGKRAQDSHYSDCDLVGRCYYINIGLNLYITKIGLFDTKGKFIVNGKTYDPIKNNGDLKI